MSLEKQLNAQKEAFQKAAPLDIQHTMSEATLTLAASGILDAVPQQGDKLKPFSLRNQNGQEKNLDAFTADGPVVITFYRGGWCPYCNLELRAYQQVLDQITDLGATLVAITPELPDESLSTKEKNELAFEVLSDPGASYAHELGLVFSLPDELRPIYKNFGIDVEKHNGAGQFDLPLAATFVVDNEQTIISAYVNADYTKRQEPEAVLTALRTLFQAA